MISLSRELELVFGRLESLATFGLDQSARLELDQIVDQAAHLVQRSREYESLLSGYHDDLQVSQGDVLALCHLMAVCGIRPGVSADCRCPDCRKVAIKMAEAGLLEGEADRWWEGNPPVVVDGEVLQGRSV